MGGAWGKEESLIGFLILNTPMFGATKAFGDTFKACGMDGDNGKTWKGEQHRSQCWDDILAYIGIE